MRFLLTSIVISPEYCLGMILPQAIVFFLILF